MHPRRVVTVCWLSQGAGMRHSLRRCRGWGRIIAAVGVALCLTGPAAAEEKKPAGKRPFRMGFTGFVYDTTLKAVTESRKFVRENGDIIAHHIEGVPWAEALGEK